MKHIEIEGGPPHAYNLLTLYSGDGSAITAHGLLELAQWIEEHKAELEQEAQDIERDPRWADYFERVEDLAAWRASMSEQEQR